MLSKRQKILMNYLRNNVLSDSEEEEEDQERNH